MVSNKAQFWVQTVLLNLYMHDITTPLDNIYLIMHKQAIYRPYLFTQCKYMLHLSINLHYTIWKLTGIKQTKYNQPWHPPLSTTKENQHTPKATLNIKNTPAHV